MVVVPNATIRHQGFLTDNTTKIQVYLPELTTEQDAELIKHTKFHEAAIIILDPNMLEPIMEVIRQAKDIVVEPEEEEESSDLPEGSDEPWDEDEDSGFSSR